MQACVHAGKKSPSAYPVVCVRLLELSVRRLSVRRLSVRQRAVRCATVFGVGGHVLVRRRNRSPKPDGDGWRRPVGERRAGQPVRAFTLYSALRRRYARRSDRLITATAGGTCSPP
jgi:hypothetical protein